MPKLTNNRTAMVKSVESQLSRLFPNICNVVGETLPPILKEYGFKDLDEAVLALEAVSMGKDFWLSSFNEIDKTFLNKYTKTLNPERAYDIITDKLKKLSVDKIEGLKEAVEAARSKLASERKIAGFTPAERKQIKKWVEQTKKIDMKHLRPEYRQEIEKLLNEVDWPVLYRSKSKLSSLENTRKFLKENPDTVLPDKVMNDLALLDKKSLRDMTFEEIESMFTAAKHLVHLNKLKNKLIIGQRLREVSEVVDESVRLVKRNRTPLIKQEANVINGLIAKKRGNKVGKIFTAQSFTPENLAITIQGQESGPIKEYLYDGINEGFTKKYNLYFQAKDTLKKATGKTDVTSWSHTFNKKAKDVEAVSIPLSNGKTIQLSKGQRMSLYLHSKNKKNWDSITSGGIRFSTDEEQLHKLSKEDFDAIIKSITPEEKRIADAMTQYLDGVQKAAINGESVKLNGYEIATEENYWPLSRSEYDIRQDPQKANLFATHRALENMGMLKERTGAKLPVLVRDAFEVYFTSIEDASSYVGFAEPLRNAKSLLMNDKFKAELRKVGLGDYHDSLNKYLEDIEGRITNQGYVDRLALDWLNRVQTAILGVNPWVMMKQPVSYLVAGTELDFRYLLQAAPTKVDWEEINKYSPQLRFRGEGRINREMGEIGEVGNALRFFTDKTFLPEKFTRGIQKFDAMTVGRIWNAVKLEVKDTQPGLAEKDFLKAVARRTEEIVNRTQPTYLPHTRSEIGRSPSALVRVATVFTTQLNKNYNSLWRAWTRYKSSEGAAKDKSNFLKSLLLILVASPLAVAGIDELRDKTYGRETSHFSRALRIIGNNMSMLYGVGQVFNSLASKIQQGLYRGYDIEDPLTGLANDGVDTLVNALATIEQIVTQEEYQTGARAGEAKWETTARRTLADAASFISTLKGIPLRNIRILTEGIARQLSPKAGYYIHSLTGNPQSSYYYADTWKYLESGNTAKAEEVLEVMIFNFGITSDGLRMSGEQRDIPPATISKALTLYRRTLERLLRENRSRR